MRSIPRPLSYNVATGASPGAPLARRYSTTRCPSTCSNITQARPAYGSCSASAESEMKHYGCRAPCFDTSQLVLSDTGAPQELNHYIVTRCFPPLQQSSLAAGAQHLSEPPGSIADCSALVLRRAVAGRLRSGRLSQSAPAIRQCLSAH